MSLHYDEIIDEKCRSAILEYTASGRKSAFIKTFGCQQNEADSEKALGILKSLGYSIADSYENADLIIFNTCAVRAHAEEKVLSLLGELKAKKRKNPELIIGIMGCMGAVPRTVELLKRDFHYVSFTLGAGAMHRLPEILFGIIKDGKRRFIIPDECEKIVEGIPEYRKSKASAYVSIMYGCNNFCSYCIVPYTRGRERSRRSECIIEECKRLIGGGAKQIMLLGQNVNSYLADMDFPTLLLAIAKIPGNFTIRFMTSHPKDVSDRLIEVMSENPEKIAPIFHLPLQSGSDRILLDMNRKYDRRKFIETAEKIKKKIPGVTLTTDVIVGYPSESEEDFSDTLDVLSRVRFDAVYAFLYSPRSGTRAAQRRDTVPEDIKRERIGRLLSMQDEISLQINRALLGQCVTLFAESFELGIGGRYSGRTAGGKLVHFSSDTPPSGNFIRVKIISAEPYSLIGEAVE